MNKRIGNILLRWLMIGILLFSCTAVVPLVTKADFVPNGIGVKVGYSGMDLSEYVTVFDYTPAQFESSFEIVEQAYSFFRGTPSTMTDADGNQLYYEYDAVVDSARGVRVSDLLSASNINTQDIWNVSFYVEDQQAEWSSFDYASLFAGNRYYFNNMSGHRHVEYFKMEDPLTGEEVTDYGTVLGYSFEEVWNDPQTCPVEPILAIEDYWESHDEMIDTDIGPNYTALTTANKYRLLYGQFAPDDANTRDSAKWVRWVYVTLYGQPSVLPADEDQKLENKVGSTGRIKFEVDDIYNLDLKQRLTEYLKISSSDESVLVITDVETEEIPGYDTAAIVYVTYEVVGEGSAMIGASFTHNEAPQNILPGNQGQIDTVLPPDEPSQAPADDAQKEELPTDEPTTEEPYEEEQTLEESETSQPVRQEETIEETSSSEEPATKQETTTGQNDHEQVPGKEQDPGDGQTPGDGQNPSDQDSHDRQQGISGDGKDSKETDVDEDGLKGADGKLAKSGQQAEAMKPYSGKQAYKLSDDVAAKLTGMQNVQVVEVSPQQVSEEEVDKLQIEDKSAEKENRRKFILLWTGCGCLGICVIGGLAEYFCFHMRLKRSLRRL